MSVAKSVSSFFKKVLLWLIVIAVLGSVAFYFIANFTYSEGSRAGVLIKFSKRGFIFKTYEGELNQGGTGNVPNTAQFNQLWEFSVRDKAIADTLMKLEGRKVALQYKQKIKNLPWDGETVYFVDGVQLINE